MPKRLNLLTLNAMLPLPSLTSRMLRPTKDSLKPSSASSKCVRMLRLPQKRRLLDLKLNLPPTRRRIKLPSMPQSKRSRT